MTATQATTPGPLTDGWKQAKGSNPFPHGDNTPIRVRRDNEEWDATASTFNWDLWVEWKPLAPTAPVEASGSELHPATADLVDRFAAELKSKLARAEAKYGYRDNWSRSGWEDELIESLAEHIQKGDPRDVAAYCAFAWHHGWSTSDAAGHFALALRPQPSGETREAVARLLDPHAWAKRQERIERAEHWVKNPDNFKPETAEDFRQGNLQGADDIVRKSLDLADRILALLSARPLALEGQHSGGEGPSWLEDALVAHLRSMGCKCTSPLLGYRPNAGPRCRLCNVEPETTPARAEAQDEGAAGEPVAFEIVSYDIYPGACWIAPHKADEYRKEYGCELRPLYAHPSPTPDADADRVREEVARLVDPKAWEKFDRLPNGGYAGHVTREQGIEWSVSLRPSLSAADAILAALKSTAAKEGEKS